MSICRCQHADRETSQPHEPPQLWVGIKSRISACKERGAYHARTTIVVSPSRDGRKRSARLLQFRQEARFDRLRAFTYSRPRRRPAWQCPIRWTNRSSSAASTGTDDAATGISLEKTHRPRGRRVCRSALRGRGGRRVCRPAPSAKRRSDGVIRFTAARNVAPGNICRNVRSPGADAYDLFREECDESAQQADHFALP